MGQVGIQKSSKTNQNRTSMFFKHASMIFSWKQVFGFSPVIFTRNRNFSRSMFTGILGMIFCSVFIVATFGCGAAFALESSANFSVIVPEVNTLEITLSDSNLVLNLTPQMAEASFGSKDLTITVGTSNIAGYNLMMNTSNTALTSAAEDTIKSLDEDEDGYTCTDASCNFTMNRWGFKKGSETAYNYVPASVSLASNDAPTNGEDTTINFASRVDAQQPAGTYSTTLTFVATVNPTSISDISQIQYLQDFATLTSDEYENVISSMETNTAYEKSDNRDEKTYNIAKLADGNIWFLDNLRLNPNVTTLTSENTNVTTTPSITFINKTSGWSGTSGYVEAWYNLSSETAEVSYGSGKNYIGGFYNSCAASAGSYCEASGSGTGNISQDLCPAGWRIPTGGSVGEYADLAKVITGTSGNLTNTTDYADFKNATHIALYGNFWNSAIEHSDVSYFWSSTFYDTRSTYYLYLDSSTAYPMDGGNGRSSGFSIRCIAKAGTEMQNLSASTVARKLANVNDVASLIDTRDYQPYSVAKLADNKIWMTKNLNLPGGTALSAADTNVSSDYISNFSTSNNLTKSGDTLVLPASSTSGFSNDNYSYVYNSNSTTCSSSSPCYSYYSWDAATLGSGRSITTDNTSAPYSICPKGWKLPSTRTGTNSTSDFRALIIAYGGSSSTYTYSASTSPTGYIIYVKIGSGTTLNLLPSGFYNSGSFGANGTGLYWTSTAVDGANARELSINSTYVYSASNTRRRCGQAIRCVIAD